MTASQMIRRRPARATLRPALLRTAAHLSAAAYPKGALLAAAVLALTGPLFAIPAAAQFFDPPLGYDRRPGYDRPYGYEPGPGVPYNRPPPVFRGNARPLPPTLIVERLEERDYEDIGRPRYDGSVYEVEATSPRGIRLRLVFDAFTGAVVERVALGRTRERGFADTGRPGIEERGWFGNNLRPPEISERRFGNRSEDGDDDTFERLARPDLSPRLAPPSRVETGPPVGPPPIRLPETGQTRSGALPREPGGIAREPGGARTAARPDPAVPGTTPEPGPRSSPRIEPAPRTETGSRVEGLNPENGSTARPAGARPARNERAAIPENNRQGGPAVTDAPRADPAARPRATRPAAPAGADASGAASAPAVTAQSAPVPRAEAPADNPEPARPDKPVRVIGGVTPMNPNGNPSAEPKP